LVIQFSVVGARMKQIYSAKNALEAHDLRLFLEAHGIEAKVFGDTNALEADFAFTPSSAPGVYVDEAHFHEAEVTMQRFFERPRTDPVKGNWTCASCGQSIAAQFDACWRCEAPRSDISFEFASAMTTETTATSDSLRAEIETMATSNATLSLATDQIPFVQVETRNRPELVFEVATVLAVAWLPFFASSLIPRQTQEAGSFLISSIWLLVNCASVMMVVLYVMYRSEVPWSRFGIKRPQWILDSVWGVATLLMTMIVLMILRVGVAGFVGVGEAAKFGRSSYQFPYPSTTLDFAALIVMAVAVGLSEELAMRSYLIPRFEQLFGSSLKSVLLSSLFFASYHLYQGIGPAFRVFFVGLSFGMIFCRLRRLWPLMIAHALMDILALAILGLSAAG
jgi:membrane protease YdiL (CAAX protease family)